MQAGVLKVTAVSEPAYPAWMHSHVTKLARDYYNAYAQKHWENTDDALMVWEQLPEESQDKWRAVVVESGRSWFKLWSIWNGTKDGGI